MIEAVSSASLDLDSTGIRDTERGVFATRGIHDVRIARLDMIRKVTTRAKKQPRIVVLSNVSASQIDLMVFGFIRNVAIVRGYQQVFLMLHSVGSARHQRPHARLTRHRDAVSRFVL